MRRKEREITDPAAIDAIIARAPVCRLGLCDGGRPYIVPMCFGYENRALYLHGAAEGYKIDILRRNPNVCFEVETDVEILISEIASKSTAHYRSVIGFGTASFVEDPEMKRKALDILMRHYSPKAFDYPPELVARTVILRVDIESMTGKQSV